MNIGLKIKEIRLNKGIKQNYIAEKMGYKSPSAISQIESGTRKLTADKVPLLAEILGVEISELFFNEKVHETRI